MRIPIRHLTIAATAAVFTFGFAAPGVSGSGGGHPDCAGRVEVSVEAPTFTVPAGDWVSVWSKAGNNAHRSQPTTPGTTFTSGEFNQNGEERDISHVDLCPAPVTTTEPPVVTTDPPVGTTEPVATTEPVDTTGPVDTSEPVETTGPVETTEPESTDPAVTTTAGPGTPTPRQDATPQPALDEPTTSAAEATATLPVTGPSGTLILAVVAGIMLAAGGALVLLGLRRLV